MLTISILVIHIHIEIHGWQQRKDDCLVIIMATNPSLGIEHGSSWS